MAQIIINIPDDKKDWIIEGAATFMGYPDAVLNPDFDDMLPDHPVDNPMTIPNPQNKAAFIKEKLIEGLKKAAIQGNNMVDLLAHENEADTINMT